MGLFYWAFSRAGGTLWRFFTFRGLTRVLRADAGPPALRGVKEDSYGSALGAGRCTPPTCPFRSGNFCPSTKGQS